MTDLNKLTAAQSLVLETLRKQCRPRISAHKDTSPHLYQIDLAKLAEGDAACVFGLGSLTFQVGSAVEMSPGKVLRIFKALEKKGLAIRETQFPNYQRPLYWWPVGLAAELRAELTQL